MRGDRDSVCAAKIELRKVLNKTWQFEQYNGQGAKILIYLTIKNYLPLILLFKSSCSEVTPRVYVGRQAL
jgi:hypothetical protein